MPIPRILLIAGVAMLAALGVMWAFDINYMAWLGVWFSTDNAFPAGAAMFIVMGVVLAWFYAGYIGSKLPGHGLVRGLVFGAVLAAAAIWALPPILHGVARAAGDGQVVFQGRGIHDDRTRVDESARFVAEPTCSPIAGVNPPFAGWTEQRRWAAPDASGGRIVPFGLAFLLYGAIVGVFLSEKTGVRK
jgi:hypothetical protein